MVNPPSAREDWPAVARALTDRMRDLRLSQQQLATRSGISTATIRALQHTAGRRAHDRTLAALSRALVWPDDHLLAVLLGLPLPPCSPRTSADAEAQDDDGLPAGHVYAVIRLAPAYPAAQPRAALVYVAFESPAAAHRFAQRHNLTDYLVSPLAFDTSTDDTAVPAADDTSVGHPARVTNSTDRARRHSRAA